MAEFTIAGLITPGERHLAITPSNTVDLTFVPRAIYCEAAGTAVLRDKFGTDISYTLVQGQVLDFRAVRVLATGTTATLRGWE